MRIAVMALLLVVGLMVGALVKRGVARSDSLELEAKTTDTTAVHRQRIVAPALPEGAPSLGGATQIHQPQYAPRDPLEWQGMLVDLSMQATCEASGQCGLAMACQRGQCGPCTRDDHCASNEGCVLDHCVAKSAVGCRSRRDCAAGELCVLSGYSADPRGNGEMTARCLAADGGTPQDPAKLAPREDVPAEPTPVRADDLMRELTKEAQP